MQSVSEVGVYYRAYSDYHCSGSQGVALLQQAVLLYYNLCEV